MNLVKYHSKLEYEFFKNFISIHTQKSYFLDIIQFFRFLHENVLEIKELKDIQTVHLVYYRNYLQNIFAPKSVNRKLSSISTYFNFLVEKGIVKDNPALSIKRPRQEVKSPTLDLSDEEVKLLIDTLQGDSKSLGLHRAIIYLFLFSGIRKSELINMKVKDFKINGNTYMINVKAKGGKMLSKAIHPLAAKEILNYLKPDKDNITSEDYLFRPTFNPKDGNTSKKLTPNAIDYIVKKYCQKANITKNITPHSLRATYIGSALENGANILEIAQDVGHSSVKTTEIYNKRRLKIANSPTFKLGFGK